MSLSSEILEVEGKVVAEVSKLSAAADIIQTSHEAYKVFEMLYPQYLEENLILEGQWIDRMTAMENKIKDKMSESKFTYELFPELGVIQVKRNDKVRHCNLVDLLALAGEHKTLNQILVVGFLLENNDTIQLYQFFTKSLED